MDNQLVKSKKKIKLVNVSKKIKEQIILDNINLDLEEGKIYGFFGHNGSGKSMLFRVISGLVIPNSGEVNVFGQNLFKGKRKFPNDLGLVIESVGLWPQYSGFENLKLLASIKNEITDQQIVETLNRVGLDSTNKKPYGKYSLGMKQRLAIAQAIMEKPQLIILDEPTNALDEDGVDIVRKILLEEKKRGATILIASHIKEDLNILSDELYKMNSGKLIKQERLEGVRTHG